LVLLQWCYDAPHYHSELGKKHYYSLLVLAHLLAGNTTTEFYHHLIEKKKLALHISSDYDGSSIDPKEFSFSAMLSPTHNVGALKAEVKILFDQIMKDGASADDLARAKVDMIGKLAFLKDGTEAFLQTISGYLAKGFTLEELNDWSKKIESVTIDDVKAAAQLVLGKEPPVTIEVYPETKATAA
jgi:zinc protease